MLTCNMPVSLNRFHDYLHDEDPIAIRMSAFALAAPGTMVLLVLDSLKARSCQANFPSASLSYHGTDTALPKGIEQCRYLIELLRVLS